MEEKLEIIEENDDEDDEIETDDGRDEIEVGKLGKRALNGPKYPQNPGIFPFSP